MTFSRKTLMLFCLLLLCITQSGCALLQLPFQVLGAAVGVAGQAVQLGVSAAPYVAPFFL